jgi:hypothetical protein
LGATWGDYDNVGWPDLYVANDAATNFLYHNKHDGTFEDLGLLSGVALSGDGMQQGSTGVAWGGAAGFEARLRVGQPSTHSIPSCF